MKMQTALDIINGKEKGFMVHFYHCGNGYLTSDYFPDKHAGEQLIVTEAIAWKLAVKFADKMKGRAVDVYVAHSDFRPVNDYELRQILNR